MEELVYNLDNDEKEYIIVDEDTIDNVKYTFFTEIEHPEKFCFRKTITENNEEYFVGLDNDNEFNKVLLHFTKKNLK